MVHERRDAERETLACQSRGEGDVRIAEQRSARLQAPRLPRRAQPSLPGRQTGCDQSRLVADPQSRQWSLNFANVRSGRLSAPMHGGFDASGRGLFFGQDEIDGSVVLVRFVITPETRNRVRFIQSYSADAGATWEDNWIAVDERR